ncbi:MAG: ThiF family adenylyltransferase [Aaplasma endosymbiont of Hyalomma asiaticum]
MSTSYSNLLKQRYDQQVLVPEIGYAGQVRLQNSSVLVVGCGGLGCAVIPILAASGIGKIILCDNDTVKASNLNRQTIYKETHIGQSKVAAAVCFVQELNSDVSVTGHNVAIGPSNFDKIMQGVDIVVDCVDRLAVKIFLNDACVSRSVALVHSVAIGFQGEIMLVTPGGRPCYRCFFEGWPVSTDINCAHSGIIGATVGVIGSLSASEVIKYLVGLSQSSIGKLRRVDLLKTGLETYRFSANPNCICCGTRGCVDPFDQESYEGKQRMYQGIMRRL